jgi:hypothetical protein
MYLKYVLNILSPLKLRAEAAPSTFIFVTEFDAGANLEFFASLAQVNESILLKTQKILRFLNFGEKPPLRLFYTS